MTRDWESHSPPGSNGDPNGPGAAAEALHRHFRTTLARAAWEEEPSSFPEVSAYVDGMLDSVEREIFETRLDWDPLLRAEVDELIALRDAMREVAMQASAAAVAPAPPAREAVSVRQETAAPAPSRAAQPHRPAARAAKRSSVPFWMIASLATAGAAAIAIFAVTWWKGVPSSPPVSTQAGGSAPPPASGADPGSAPPSSAPSPASARPPAPAAAAILIRDAGRIIAVDTGGRPSGLPETMTAKADMVVQALRAGVLPGAAAHKGLGQRDITLMGGATETTTETLAVLAPIATVVRETQPTFRWTAQTGARAYIVTIYSASFDVVIASPPVRDTAWKSTTVLRRGAMYLWQVSADTPEGRVNAPTPPAPDARFRVIDDAARRALESELVSAGSSRLLAGLLFADAGLLDDAEQAFTALAKENPGSEPITRLLTRVRERKRQE